MAISLFSFYAAGPWKWKRAGSDLSIHQLPLNWVCLSILLGKSGISTLTWFNKRKEKPVLLISLCSHGCRWSKTEKGGSWLDRLMERLKLPLMTLAAYFHDRCQIFRSASHKQAVYWSVSQTIPGPNSTTTIVTEIEDRLSKEFTDERIWCIIILCFNR